MKIKGDLDSKCTKMDNESLKNMDNMVLFNDLSEAPLLHNLRKRFYDDDIYT
jgi:myosin heavy subunit